jgi:OOP family OmpA-OmpF porin
MFQNIGFCFLDYLKGGSMMMNKYFTIVFGVIISALMIGCQAHTPEVRHPVFEPVDLSAQLESGEYRQRVDNFVVVLDASRSAGGVKVGQTSFEKGKDFLYRMNRTLPDMKLGASMRSFGHWSGGKETMLNYGPTTWNRDDFQRSVDQVPWGAGKSPVDLAIDQSGDDMAAMTGETAVIVIGDGEYAEVDGVGAARRLKERFGANVCIYTVLAGGVTPEKMATMRDIASAGECGFYQDANNLQSSQGMADWVREVFLEKGQVVAAAPLDSDGDGVIDSLDQCPDTPKGDRVDNVGCTVIGDADGDGVIDSQDQCPGTPMGAPVNPAGCWKIADIEFGLDSAMITPEHHETLNQIARVLSKNPDVRVDIIGHACTIGSQTYNARLSTQRAQAAAHYLRQKGVSPSQVTSQGLGFSYPTASNDTEWGRERNRRAEFKWSR